MIKLLHGCCLQLMKDIPENSIDCCITDLPYGITNCSWDTVIPFEPMWKELKRIVKDNGAICLFGSEPFSSHLRLSNLKMFKYDWIWQKNKCGGFVNAKLKPLKSYEFISIFSKGKTSNGNKNNMVYFPQDLKPFNKLNKLRNEKADGNKYSRPSNREAYLQKWTNYPKDILKFNTTNDKSLHPTQKPVALLEYLIKTYTLEGETVLDFTCGSGSTGAAAQNLNRDCILIEKEKKYYDIAKERLGI